MNTVIVSLLSTLGLINFYYAYQGLKNFWDNGRRDIAIKYIVAFICYLPILIAIEKIFPHEETILDAFLALFWGFGSGYIVYFHARRYLKIDIGKLFGGGGTNKNKLIRNLVKERIVSDSMAASMGFDKTMADSLTDFQLAGLPEATVVTIVETWAILSKKGVPEEEILERIEAHRSSLGDSGDIPSPLTLSSYIKYRLELEHGHGAQIREDFIDYAIGVAKKAFL